MVERRNSPPHSECSDELEEVDRKHEHGQLLCVEAEDHADRKRNAVSRLVAFTIPMQQVNRGGDQGTT